MRDLILQLSKSSIYSTKPLVVLSLLSVIGLGVINGITYSKWMPLLGNNATFGVHQFSIKVNVKECIKGCMLAILTMVPFIIVIGIMIAPVFQQLIMMSMLGQSEPPRESWRLNFLRKR
ncbi:hypothetical protein AM384_03310 [Escherichia coli]|nr:hypothetical protein AM384_03310 [Escherichia coli]